VRSGDKHGQLLPELAPDKESALLEARARRYASVAENERRIVATVVSFRRGRGQYAIALADLKEIRPLTKVCLMPGASSVTPGVVYYRGELLSLHDLAVFVSGRTPEQTPAWVLVVEHGKERIGLMADELSDVIALEEGALKDVPLTLGDAAEAFCGVTEAGILVAEVSRIFQSERLMRAY
jgi:chemotaxis signal transduction protein